MSTASSSSSSVTRAATVVAGRYRLLDQVGSGGMGSVWRAHDLRTGHDVALKVLGRHSSALLARFVREQAVRVRHPRVVAPHEILLDAPPVHREVDFKIDVYFPKSGRYRPLGEISPVVRALGLQFDDYVKRVRIFAHPRVAEDLASLPALDTLVQSAITRTDG